MYKTFELSSFFALCLCCQCSEHDYSDLTSLWLVIEVITHWMGMRVACVCLCVGLNSLWTWTCRPYHRCFDCNSWHLWPSHIWLTCDYSLPKCSLIWWNWIVLNGTRKCTFSSPPPPLTSSESVSLSIHFRSGTMAKGTMEQSLNHSINV